MSTINDFGAIIPNQNGTVDPPPGMYWKDPNTLAMIPQPAIGTAAGQTQNAYTTAATPALAGLINGTSSTAAGGGGSLSPMSSLSSAAGFNSGAGTSTPGGAGTPGVGGTVPGVSPIDMTQSNAANLAAAKDTAGSIGRSELDSLRSAAGETGQLGGGAEAQGERDIIENAASQIGGVNRQNMTDTAKSNLTTELANQSAGVTQRGQDIQSQEAQAQLALAQQEFASNQSLNMLKLALGAGSGGSSIVGSLY